MLLPPLFIRPGFGDCHVLLPRLPQRLPLRPSQIPNLQFQTRLCATDSSSGRHRRTHGNASRSAPRPSGDASSVCRRYVTAVKKNVPPSTRQRRYSLIHPLPHGACKHAPHSAASPFRSPERVDLRWPLPYRARCRCGCFLRWPASVAVVLPRTLPRKHRWPEEASPTVRVRSRSHSRRGSNWPPESPRRPR